MIFLFAYLFEGLYPSDVCVLLDQGILLSNAVSRTYEKEIIKDAKIIPGMRWGDKMQI
jgi:hypothetical protein